MTIASPDRPADRIGWWQRVLVALPIMVLAAFTVVVTAVPAVEVRQLSVLDETSHIDSVFKVPAIDRSGEKYSERTLDEVSCRGGIAQWPDWQPPPCGIPQGVPADDYPIGSGGYNATDIHPPTYYYLTAGLAAAAGWFVDADQVTLMRLTGSLYLAAGICLTWLLARRLGANRWSAFGACGLLASAPGVMYMSSIVNVDALVILASAVFGLLVLSFHRRPSAHWVLPLFAAGLVLVKLTNFGALIVAALFLIIGAATARGTRTADGLPDADHPPVDPPPTLPPAAAVARWRENLRVWAANNGAATARAVALAGLMAVAAVVVTLGWSKIQAARAVIPAGDLWFTQQFMVDRLTATMVGSALGSYWSPTDLWFSWLSARPYLSAPLLIGTGAGLLALTVASWFRRRAVFPMLLASGLAMIVAAPLAVLVNYVANGLYFSINFRYGLSLLPFLAAAMAAGLRTRVGGGVLAAVAVVGMTTTLLALPW